MDKKIKFAIEDIEKYVDDTNPELAIAKIKFLSTRPNSHKINITDDILKRDASTILGKFLIGKMNVLGMDAKGHEPDEQIFGYFPTEQKIDFEEDTDGYLSASANAVISKLYANDYYNMFINDNKRDVSVEMTTYGMEEYPNGSSDIEGLNLTGCTTLGHNVKPSCPDAQMSIIQFSEKKANEFYKKTMNDSNELKKFAEKRKQDLAENYENHSVDTSKDAVDMGDWNGNKAKKDLLKEKNFESIGKKVCLDFKGGDRILENCKYPVMNLKDGKWVYNAEGLASARAYGEQHDATVAKKAIAIQKKLGLYKDNKKEDTKKMAESKKNRDVTEMSDDKSLNTFEDNIDMGDDQTKCADDTEMSDDPTKCADETDMADDPTKCSEDEDTDDDEEDKKDDDEKKMSLNANLDSATLAEMLEAQEQKYQEIADKLEEKDNIIMGQEEELADLRQFKSDCLEKEKMATVSETLAKVKDKMTDEDYAKCEKEGTECKFEEVQAWKNGVLANLVDTVLFSGKNESHMRMSIFHDEKDNENKSLWEKL